MSPQIPTKPDGNQPYSRTQGTLRDDLFIKRVPSYYTALQVGQWLSCIRYPIAYTESEISSGMFPTTLENLEDLIRLHLISFPFENTSMHYTPDHMMDVTHAGVFRRLVLERQGSYCFGLNGLFLGMIRGLGYRAYSGAARVNTTPDNLINPILTSLSHMVIFVQPFEDSNQTYLVDVGFGSTGLVRPILLSDAEGNIVMGTNPTEMHRLVRGPHPLSSTNIENPHRDRIDFGWNLQVMHRREGEYTPEARLPWQLLFFFTENESYPIDIENNSHVICTKRVPEGLLWNSVLCVKYALLHEARDLDAESASRANLLLANHQYTKEEKEKFMYRYTMVRKEVRRDVGGNAVTVRKLTTELERLHALREVFGIGIPDEAQAHILGRDAALH